MKSSVKTEKRDSRRRRIRAKITGTKECPRLSIFKSNTRLVAQLIDDENGNTLAMASSSESKGKTKEERIKEAGQLLAKRAKENKVENVVFDRGGFAYTGNIKAFADSARESGLTF
ncbi:MAG: 50S ribosomal protein L18 [Candidatus Pacebacteria bacterium]|jgi:large subunit ribosomal protein L18|nr:50S ribosomal protein L18 [bacterium]MDP6527296.1 50S ribosomal protein L18 [Candidatus Paceibacterota bacterium]MDP6659426.1 50S ribosomal protein L18 [Candidatus Paceibacterota bacterium]|tara:strand:- start:13450 stop:13797 length:348 start_codon:yes stop_codon:yes gene_type:complete